MYEVWVIATRPYVAKIWHDMFFYTEEEAQEMQKIWDPEGITKIYRMNCEIIKDSA
jgi:hypothetical protein